MNIPHSRAHEIWATYSSSDTEFQPGQIITPKVWALTNFARSEIESIIFVDYVEAFGAWEAASSPHDFHMDCSAIEYNCRVIVVDRDGEPSFALADYRSFKPAENANA